jgi:flagellar export protein FliJ
MEFRFQLEGLLRVRRLLERQARERLDGSMMRLRALEHSLTEASQWSQKTAAIRSSKKLLPAAELQFIESVLRRTAEAIILGQRQKQEEEQRAAELRTWYLDARRERKTVSTLRENALRQFQAEQSRREQSVLDEMFLAKLMHARNARQQGSSRTNPKPNP